MEQKEFTLEMLEKAVEKVFKNYPYPKHLGDGLYQLADNCIVGEKMMKVIDESAAIIPKEAMDRIHKQISCKWFRGGDCGKGLPGTPCELKGCVAWEEYKEEKMNLEKEIEKYYYDNFAFLSSTHIPTLDILTVIAKHFIEWQKQQDQQTIELAEDHAMLAGMMKEREQMLKNAVDVIVGSPVLGPPMVCCIAKGCNNGDKVKLIIIKEEEQ